MERVPMRPVLAGFAVLALVSPWLPAGEGFHEAGYSVPGTATLQPPPLFVDVAKFPAVLTFSGAENGGVGLATLEMFAPLGGPPGEQALYSNTFEAREEYKVVRTRSCTAVIEPYFLNSTQPGLLKLDAIMFHDTCTGGVEAFFWGSHEPAPGVRFLLELYMNSLAG